jgi:cytochrome P450 family 135
VNSARQRLPELPLPGTVQRWLWAYRPTTMLDLGRRTLGPVFAISRPGFPRLAVTGNASDVLAVFRALDEGRDGGTAANRVLLPVVGPHSVLVTQGGEHRARRREIRGQADAWGRRYRDEIATHSDAAVSRWPSGRPVPLFPYLRSLALDLLLTILFGCQARPWLVDDLRQLLSLDPRASRAPSGWDRRGAPSEPWPLLTRGLPRFEAAMAALLADPVPGSALAVMRQADPGADPSVLRDTLTTMLVTGFETVAIAMAWTLERLTRSAHAVAAVDERAAGDDPDDVEAYAHMAVLEALRLRPVIPVVTRTLTEPLPLAGRELPAGGSVGLAGWLVHRDPENYSDPLRFIPERFAGLAKERALPQLVQRWLPFGGGTRRCLGDRFAVDVAQAVLTSIVRQFRVSAPAAAAEMPARRSITIVPSRGCLVLLTRRSRDRHQVRAGGAGCTP